MPRFFFHIYDGTARPDEDGVELTDLRAARAEAAHFAGKCILDGDASHWPHGVWRLTVEDEGGAAVLTLTVTTS